LAISEVLFTTPPIYGSSPPVGPFSKSQFFERKVGPLPESPILIELTRRIAKLEVSVGDVALHFASIRISIQAANREIVNAETVIPEHKIRGQLVEKVAPLVGGFLVHPGHLDRGLGLPLRPRLAPAVGPLCLAELALGFAVESGSGHRVRAIGESDEIDQPQIDTNDLGAYGYRDVNVAVTYGDALRDAKSRPVSFPTLETRKTCPLIEKVDEGPGRAS
jgi:hypothetical protein